MQSGGNLCWAAHCALVAVAVVLPCAFAHRDSLQTVRSTGQLTASQDAGRRAATRTANAASLLAGSLVDAGGQKTLQNASGTEAVTSCPQVKLGQGFECKSLDGSRGSLLGNGHRLNARACRQMCEREGATCCQFFDVAVRHFWCIGHKTGTTLGANGTSHAVLCDVPYTIVVPRGSDHDGPIGIDTTGAPSQRRVLKVKNIGGAAQASNHGNPPLCEGDLIVAVNGKTGDSIQLKEELDKALGKELVQVEKVTISFKHPAVQKFLTVQVERTQGESLGFVLETYHDKDDPLFVHYVRRLVKAKEGQPEPLVSKHKLDLRPFDEITAINGVPTREKNHTQVVGMVPETGTLKFSLTREELRKE